jgi:hypothetical protein
MEIIPLLAIIANLTELLSNCKFCRERSPQFFANYQRQANIVIARRTAQRRRARERFKISVDQRAHSPEIISIACQ